MKWAYELPPFYTLIPALVVDAILGSPLKQIDVFMFENALLYLLSSKELYKTLKKNHVKAHYCTCLLTSLIFCWWLIKSGFCGSIFPPLRRAWKMLARHFNKHTRNYYCLMIMDQDGNNHNNSSNHIVENVWEEESKTYLYWIHCRGWLN